MMVQGKSESIWKINCGGIYKKLGTNKKTRFQINIVAPNKMKENILMSGSTRFLATENYDILAFVVYSAFKWSVDIGDTKASMTSLMNSIKSKWNQEKIGMNNSKSKNWPFWCGKEGIVSWKKRSQREILEFQNSLSPDSTEFLYGFPNTFIYQTIIVWESREAFIFPPLFLCFDSSMFLSSYLIVTIIYHPIWGLSTPGYSQWHRALLELLTSLNDCCIYALYHLLVS